MSPELLRERTVRREDGLLGRMGELSVRLARTPEDIAAAQSLRHRVFVENGAASPKGREHGLETDRFDGLCDHLLVEDRCGQTVGTYRLLCGNAGTAFYTDGEFDLAPALARHRGRRLLELGRSCVHPSHRDRRTIELLWQGVWAYAVERKIEVMFGCASLPGTEPCMHAEGLSILHERTTPPEWHVGARGAQGFSIASVARRVAEPRRALEALPPLVKGYLRLGGRFGPDAVIDPDFGCIDVLVVLERAWITPRYLRHYGNDASRFA